MESNKLKKRKKDHLNLALNSQTGLDVMDDRFMYEPLLAAHPKGESDLVPFLGKQMKHPLWISSMTGGTEYAGHINRNLAKACGEFGLGMGLGSCRVLLEEKKYFDHFNLREYITDEYPFYANLGISQVEKYYKAGRLDEIVSMVDRLHADGLIIHINPIQEWLQPEGDIISIPPLETIQAFLEATNVKVIVKEVGQGFGYQSLKALMQLPLVAVDFGAFGGTNFAKIEMERNDVAKQQLLEPLCYIGNDAYSMISYVNQILKEDDNILCKEIIVSGGVRNYLDGYYFIQNCDAPAVYGQASMFLKHAREDYHQLQDYVRSQIKGLAIAKSYLTIHPNARL